MDAVGGWEIDENTDGLGKGTKLGQGYDKLLSSMVLEIAGRIGLKVPGYVGVDGP